MAYSSQRWQGFGDDEIDWLADTVQLAEDFASSVEEAQGLVRLPTDYNAAGRRLRAELEGERTRRGLPTS